MPNHDRVSSAHRPTIPLAEARDQVTGRPSDDDTATPADIDKQAYMDRMIPVATGMQASTVLEPLATTEPRMTGSLSSLRRASC